MCTWKVIDSTELMLAFLHQQKYHRKILEVMDMFIILTVMMISLGPVSPTANINIARFLYIIQ